MNRFFVSLFVTAFAFAANAQTATAPKPATAAKTPTTPATAKPSANPAPVEPWIKLPAGVPHVVHGPVKLPFALRYEDIKVGAGALGETGKLWHLKYTGWRAADGIKFDSWDDHRLPEVGPDGKPKLGPDGKPVLAEPKPIEVPQGVGRVIPGFDFGLDGMKIGGKRRIFIPWQMAYGTHSIPDHTDAEHQVHPGIPAKSDLIFDVELVDVTDMPAPPHPTTPPGGHPIPIQPHPGTGVGTGGSTPPSATPAPKPALPPSQTAPPPVAPTGPQTAPTTSTPAQPAAPAQPSTTQPSPQPPPQQK